MLGAAYREGAVCVKETAFSGVFDSGPSTDGAWAIVTVHDPMYSDSELSELGWTPHRLGAPVDGVVLHADHSDYDRFRSETSPGATAVVDGRRMLDRSRFPGVAFIVLGKGNDATATGEP